MADEDPVDALYGAPLEEFTARRDAAAKAAKTAGDAALAARLKAAKKPNATAWACNHVARTEPAAVKTLLEAGHALRLAHARMVQHGEAPEMRRAMDAARAAEEPLVAAAKKALEAAGHAATLDQLRRVRDTLHAAAVGSDALRADLSAGRLVKDLEMPSLLDIAAGLPDAPPPAAAADDGAEEEPSDKPTARPSAKDRVREAAAEHERRAQEEQRERARKEKEEAQRVATLRAADKRVADREKDLADAERTLARAREALDDALAARKKLGD